MCCSPEKEWNQVILGLQHRGSQPQLVRFYIPCYKYVSDFLHGAKQNGTVWYDMKYKYKVRQNHLLFITILYL